MLSVDIVKTYGCFRLHAAFEAENETLGLLGASGSGKSLTLRCIAGVARPDSGRIVLDGRVLFDSERRIDLPPQQRRVGYLFQQYALFPNMTVEQNLAAGLFRLDGQSRRRRVREAVQRFRLEGAEGKYPRQLSGGQQQRTALGRILLSEPEAVLLDEPFAALDAHLKWQLEQELADTLEAFGRTAVLVTHDAGEVRRSCARVLVLDAGTASPVMTTETLFTRPPTVGAAMLAGCHTFAAVQPAASGVYVPAWGATLQTGRALGDATTLGIRDDRIRLASAPDTNTLACRVLRAVDEEENGCVLTLLPEMAEPHAPRLRMALSREVWYTVCDRQAVRVTVAPEDILLLP